MVGIFETLAFSNNTVSFWKSEEIGSMPIIPIIKIQITMSQNVNCILKRRKDIKNNYKLIRIVVSLGKRLNRTFSFLPSEGTLRNISYRPDPEPSVHQIYQYFDFGFPSHHKKCKRQICYLQTVWFIVFCCSHPNGLRQECVVLSWLPVCFIWRVNTHPL